MIDRLSEAIGLTRWQVQLIVTGGVVLVLSVLRWTILAVVHRRIEDSAVWYRTRKMLSYVITIVGAIVLASVWLEGSGLATYVGFLTAGIAIALSDVLKNLAGWAFIVLRRPFRLGDRIEIGEHTGDVVDMRAFRFTLLEVGNRVDAEQSTGRLLHVPNGLVFSEVLANFTTGFQYVWHEIPVLVTFESDWEKAEQIVLESVRENAPDMSDAAVSRELRQASAEYQIRFTHLSPTVYLTVRNSGVLLTGRLLVPVREIRAVEEKVWKHVLRAIAAADDVALAYPTVRTTIEDRIRLERE